MRVLKGFAIVVVSLVLVFGIYLVFPPLTSSEVSRRIMRGEVCKADTSYVTSASSDIHQEEGYAYVIDDNCATLQKDLIESIRNNDVDSMRRSIDSGANPQTADWSSFEPVYPLHVAVYQDAATVRILLENGADVNKELCCCASCSSPLGTAVQENRTEVVRLLLAYGANVDYRPKFTDGEPYSPRELAIQKGNSEIIELIAFACGDSLKCRVSTRAAKLQRLLN